MADTTITLSSFEDACAECADAIAASDWGLAYSWYARAEAINAALAVQVRSGAEDVRRREGLNGLKEALAAAQAASTRSGDTRRLVTTRTRYPG